MITFFSIPKPNIGNTAILQRNAVLSWVNACPSAQVVLFGQDAGVQDLAANCGVAHGGGLRCNEFGTPLLSDAFNKIASDTVNDILVYVNSDIVITPDFCRVLLALLRNPIAKRFLASGRRVDVNSLGHLDFSSVSWLETVTVAQRAGKLHGWSGLDYFIFPKTLNLKLPDFPVGRPGWDTWLLFNCRHNNIPVIDMTPAISVLHQNHSPAYSHTGPEAIFNLSLAGGYENFSSLREADYVFSGKGLERPNIIKWCFSLLARSPVTRFVLGMKRRFQRIFLV